MALIRRTVVRSPTWPGDANHPRRLWVDHKGPEAYGRVLDIEWDGDAGIGKPGSARVDIFYPGEWESLLQPAATAH